jgi:hypothetical protein
MTSLPKSDFDRQDSVRFEEIGGFTDETPVEDETIIPSGESQTRLKHCDLRLQTRQIAFRDVWRVRGNRHESTLQSKLLKRIEKVSQ